MLTVVCMRTKKQSIEDDNLSASPTCTVLSLTFDEYDSLDGEVPRSPSSAEKERDEITFTSPTVSSETVCS
ncbi:hypothetical protein AHF37_12400 [Paragonimus kellicotti]|nr:hypothetical protein AHF37_12400 [Paragonimus kellicotti]